MSITASHRSTAGQPPLPLTIVRRLFDVLGRFPLSLILLVTRIAVGSVFLKAGLLKYQSWELTLLLFRDEYKVPLIDPLLLARMATFNELVFSTLLIVGLATRMATLPFFGMIVVIQTLVYPDAWTEHLLWASGLLLLVTRGGGALSIDFLIDRWLGDHHAANRAFAGAPVVASTTGSAR